MQTQSNDARRATYDDVLKAPEHMVAELIDGVLYISPHPASLHALARSVLGASLGRFQLEHDGPGGWWLVDQPEVHLGSDVLVPDCAGWSRKRMPEFPDAAFFTLAPDWVCEVLSPETEGLDRTKKLAVYARERVPHVWLVKPLTKTLEVFEFDPRGWLILAVHSGHGRVRAVAFDAVEIELARLWGETPGDEPSAGNGE
jgi:Uma2 family endonuclease